MCLYIFFSKCCWKSNHLSRFFPLVSHAQLTEKEGGCIKSTHPKPKQLFIACCLQCRVNQLFVLVTKRNLNCLQFNIYLAGLLWLTMWVFKAHRIKVCIPNYLRSNFALNRIFQTHQLEIEFYNLFLTMSQSFEKKMRNKKSTKHKRMSQNLILSWQISRLLKLVLA